MTRSRPLAAAGLALAAAALACTKAASTSSGIRFRQPSAVAAFSGRTLKDPTNVRPYLVVANASRNDLTVLDAVDDTPVQSPIKLRALVLPMEDRPALLASASLGDGKSDLLVAVAGGDSVLQVVETWNAANLVRSDPPLAVDLAGLPGLSPGDGDVLALAAVPSAPGTARIAAALSGARVAIVEYGRAPDGEGIAVVSSAVSAALPFRPEAIVAMPGDPAGTALYLATRDEVAPGVSGVAELSLDLATVRALGARAPTRLVAAARLTERRPDSAASDQTAFDGQPTVRRVYAVLDESGCGPGKPIGCGVVTLDPSVASGAQAIPPDDYAGFMPYRAPMRVGGRPLAIVASAPPAKPPPDVSGEPDWQALGSGFMRLYMGTIARATTGVAAVASDDGGVYFLDLGRFESGTVSSVVKASRGTGTPQSSYVTVTQNDQRRLWIEIPGGTFPPEDANAVNQITATPGFTPDESWSVTYQGTLTDDLVARAGEAGEATPPTASSPGRPWIALQLGAAAPGGTRTFTEVVRLWDAAVGVHAGDVLVIKAAAVPGCVGTDPPGTTTTPTTEVQKEFEVEVLDFLEPTAAYPGGAVSVTPRRTSENEPEWTTCYGALTSAASGTSVLGGLTVTVRAGELVLLGKSVGYAGRPTAGQTYTLGYSSEDALAASCPLEGWAGTLPAPACSADCRTTCETLALVRKARRFHHVSVDCSTDAGNAAACETTWPPGTYPFPVVNGPVLSLQVDVQQKGSTTPATAVRKLNPLTFTTSSGVAPYVARGSSTSPYGASGAIAFDRSAIATDPVAGYRFLVSYPADFVLDATPSQSGAPAIVIR